MGKLDRKIALITGGSNGIGFATAQQFIAEGAEHVYITGRRQHVLDEAVKKIGSKNLTSVQGDVSNMSSRLDVVFANAAVTEAVALGTITEKHFDDHINTNVKGLLFTVQKALPILVDGASIILNALAASVKANADASVYNATKVAVRSFARTWTVDLKEHKIRVNVVSTGPIETTMFRSFGNTPEEKKASVDYVTARTTMNRIGTSNEVAKAVLFLSSDDSSYITGIELFVDGGTAQI